MAVPITIASGERRELEWQVVKQELFTDVGRVETEREVEFFLCRGDRSEVHGLLPGGGAFHLNSLGRGSYRLLFRTTETAPEHREWGGVDFKVSFRDVANL
jgi:hypothetical protein